MLRNYIILAFKVLGRRKFFTFISLFAISFTLAILIMATSMLDQDFGPMAPETKLDRTLGVYSLAMSGPDRRTTSEPGYGFLDQYVRPLPDVERITIYSSARAVSTYLAEEKHKVWLKFTDGEFWKVLDFEFDEGMPFSVNDDLKGNRVAVISLSTARRFFGDQSALGKSITADGQSYDVVGVVHDVTPNRSTPFADIWVPIGAIPGDIHKTQLMGGFEALILAHSSEDFPRIKSDFAAALSRVQFTGDGGYDRMMGAPETYFQNLSRQMFSEGNEESHPGALLTVIISLMVLFMLLPTVNLININVSRILERTSEIGVRKAFGAPSLSLIGQFVVENVLLTLIGGAIGFVVAMLALYGLSATELIPYAKFHISYRVLLYSLALTLFFGLLSGVYPAWRMSRLQPVDALRGRIS